MRKFGLIGKTLGHSFSKTYFENKFLEENITNCSYENYELADIKEIKNLLANNPEIEGLNITLPYKESVIEFLDEQDESVKETGKPRCMGTYKHTHVHTHTHRDVYTITYKYIHT